MNAEKPFLYRIISDDLTGAADVAAPLATWDAPAKVGLHPSKMCQAPVVSIDGDYRSLDEKVVASQITAFVKNHQDDSCDILWIQKIDSLLRGDVAKHIEIGLCAHPNLKAAVIVPAIASQNRYFRTGRVCSEDGKILSRNIEPELQCLGLKVGTISPAQKSTQELEVEIDGFIKTGTNAILVDTLPGDSLIPLATVLKRKRNQVLAVGTAGLSEAMQVSAIPAAPLPFKPPVVFVVGSQASAVRAQISTLEASLPIIRLSLPDHDWECDETINEQIQNTLQTAKQQNCSVVFDITPPTNGFIAGGNGPSRHLTSRVIPHLEDAGCVVLSGGDTARAFFECAEVTELEVNGCFEPGIPVCRSERLNYPLILKSGGFADANIFLRIIESALKTSEASTT